MDLQNKKIELDRIGLIFILIIIGAIFVSNLSISSAVTRYYADYVINIIIIAFVAFIVWIEKNNLKDFHFDRWTLLTLIFTGSVIHRRIGLQDELVFQVLICLFSISTLLFFILNRSRIPGINLTWTIRGFVLGLFTLFPVILIETFIPTLSLAKPLNPTNSIILEIIRRAIYELSYVVPAEEILFRGLLWGYLERIGWKDNRIFWFQAILFWVSHVSRIGYPISFFVTIPIGTLVFSIIVRYSKQLFPAIIAHTSINSMLPVILYFLTIHQ